MKKILFIFAIILILMGCTPLKEDGSFGYSEFVGKFKGITVYKVSAPDGTTLFLGINEEDQSVSTHVKTGKNSYSRVIIIDGKEVSLEEARKILK